MAMAIAFLAENWNPLIKNDQIRFFTSIEKNTSETYIHNDITTRWITKGSVQHQYPHEVNASHRIDINPQKSYVNYNWLVVWTPLKNMKVSWDDEIPNWMEQ